ncbi:MAG: glycosyltransferase family 9 protein [Deltaproteobacteria bacterium]|nr:glycosyltransferase family 9 protein [Deltaproteobacteria bacterium]
MTQAGPAAAPLALEDKSGRQGTLVPLKVRKALTERPEPEAVIVLRFSALGDVVLTTPALGALRAAWPNARILYAVKERFVPLVQGNPDLAQVIPLRAGEGPLSFARRLKAEVAGAKSVAVLDLHGKIRSVLLRALLPRAWPRVVFHKRDLADTLPVKLALRPWRSEMLFADRYHAAVEELVGRRLPRGQLRAFLDPEAVTRVTALLRARGVDPARPLVGLSPGANWETKRWPTEHFAGLAAQALRAGLQVVIQGSASERPLCAAIARAAPGAIDLSDDLDLPGLTALISRCSAWVANDSGPMHLARALGVPTLALFGSTDPGMFAWEGHRVLFRELPCSPCSFFGRRRCPRGHFDCLRGISADDAFTALEKLVHGGRPAPLGA